MFGQALMVVLVVYHPDSDTKAYIATETGVWSTDLLNGSSTIWSPEITFPTVKTSMLKYRSSDRTIAAATYGRGLWTATIPNATCSPAAITTQPTATTVCTGANATFTVTATGFAPLTYQWQVSTTGTGGTFTNIGTNSATLTLTAVTAAMNNNFYHVIVTNTCPSTVTSANVLLTVQNTLAPTVTSPIAYCQNATAAALTGTGTNLLWYGTNATGGTGSSTAPTPSTTTLGNTTYYVSQTGPCGEGPRASIIVNVTAAPSAPVVTPNVAYCQGATATALTASGTNLLWYTAATTGTGTTTAPIPQTTTAGSTIYYVSQTTSGCESPRSSITVNVTASPSAPTVTTPVTYCQNATATALTATGTNLLWYGTNATGGTGNATAPIPNTTTLGNIIYYVSQSNGTCESPRAGITVSVVASTPAPTVTSPVSYCQGSTSSALTATGTNLLWYGINATGGTGSSTAPIPSTTSAGSTTYYVSQTTSCGEGPRVGIVVNVVATTSAPTAITPIAYCQGATATALSASGSNLLWYTNSTGGTGSATAPIPSTAIVGSTVYYVTQTVGCESPRTGIVVNISATASAPSASSPINYCQGGTAVALTATGSSLQWYTVGTGGTGSATAPIPSTTTSGTVIYYVSQTTGSCESSRTPISVIVSAGPAITTQPLDITSCTTTATFNVTASGTNLTYQWQLSIDGGLIYSNIASATSSSYTVSGLTSAQAINKYRVVVSAAGCSSATSNSVTARVGTAPSIVLTASPTTNFNPATNGGLYTTVSPVGNYTYQWKRNNVILSTVTSSSITKANGLLDEFGSYQVTVLNVASGCSAVSNTVSVSDINGQRNRLFLSPNPTQGIVKLSYYSSNTAAQGRIVSVYDSKGAKVISKSFTVSGNYGSTELNFTSMEKGTYLVILRDAAGKKIVSERLVKF